MTKETRISLLNKRSKMMGRCSNPNNKSYKWYGAKGIKVCDEWKNNKESFVRWAEMNNYKIGDSIERFDNSKDYCPENCCLIPFNQQSRNTSRNVFIEYQNQILIISDVARLENVSVEAVRKRIKRGRYHVVDNPNRLRVNPNTFPIEG